MKIFFIGFIFVLILGFLYLGYNLHGGGGVDHVPPASIKSAETIVLLERHTVWGSSSSKLSKRYTDFRCFYRFSPVSEFNLVLGEIVSESAEGLDVQHTIPSRELLSEQKLEYYFKVKFDGMSRIFASFANFIVGLNNDKKTGLVS